MIHATVSLEQPRALCLWLWQDGDAVTSTETLITCPLCKDLLPLHKAQLQRKVEELQAEAQGLKAS